ncbi:MAG: hypothetical protein GY835_10225 [bacterium]|nr:hypothetical protein [bacterium]
MSTAIVTGILLMTLMIAVPDTSSAMDRWEGRSADTRAEPDLIFSDRSCETPECRSRDYEAGDRLADLLFRVSKPASFLFGLALGAPGLGGAVDVGIVLPWLLVPMSGDPDELEPDPEP